MTGDRLNDDAFERDDDLFEDDEFVLDLGADDVQEDDGDLAPFDSVESPALELVDSTDEPEVAASISDDLFALSDEVEPDPGFGADPNTFGELVDDGAEFDLDVSDEIEFVDDEDLMDDDEGSSTVADPFVLVDKTPDAASGELDPEDMLFEDGRDDVSELSEFGADLGNSFGDQPAFELPNEDVTVDHEEVSSDTFGDLDSDEVEIHEMDLEPEAWDGVEDQPGSAVEGIAPQEAGAFRVLEPSDEIAGLDDGWDDEPADELDPIYGDVEEEGMVVAEATDAGEPVLEYDDDVDYSEYEEAYADGTVPTGPSGEVVGGVSRGSRFKLVAGLAAMLPIAAVGTIAFLNPQWLGGKAPTHTDQPQVVMVDRIRVERPTVELTVATPAVAFNASTDAGGAPELGNPDSGHVAITDPEDGSEVADPVPTPENPVVGTTPPTDPEVEQPNVLAGGTTDSPELGDAAVAPVAPEQAEFIQAGDNLLIAKFDGERTHAGPAVTRDLQPGREAFAQLTNGAYFTGTVRRVDAAMITLALATGEIALRYDELRVLTPLEHADLSEVTSTQRGFVRLRNQQRLFGAILRDAEHDRVTLMSDGAVIDVPQWQIDTVGYEAARGVEIVDDDDDDWLRRRVRSRMQNR